MKKLDSFLREVMRVEPLGWSTFSQPCHISVPFSSPFPLPRGAGGKGVCLRLLFTHKRLTSYPFQPDSFARKVLKPITLSNGQVIPAGCVVEVAAHSAMNDPKLVADPDVFDPLRYYKMREQEGLEGLGKAGAGATNQFVSVNSGNLTFGYGRHACPGRFFAANEIKMIMGRALLDYDVKLVDGVSERYPNIQIAESVSNVPILCYGPGGGAFPLVSLAERTSFH